MNKVFIVALIAGGLLLLDSPEAAADKQVRNQHQSRQYHDFHSYGRDTYRRNNHNYRNRDYKRHGYYRDNYHRSNYKRARHLPHWLRHQRSFVRWYEHSPLRRDRYIAWHILFDIYRAERRYHRYYRY